MRFPEPIERLMQYFRMLPGVGPKTATRYALSLLRRSDAELSAFGTAIVGLHQGIFLCGTCFNFSSKNPCEICRDMERDHTMLCVVAKPQDLHAIESTGDYRGLYHVLHGTLSPLEGITPDQLKISHLVERIKNANPKIIEVILGLNPDMEGETTSMYLRKLLQDSIKKITRLARGLPTGGDLEYADELTLSAALQGRKEV